MSQARTPSARVVAWIAAILAFAAVGCVAALGFLIPLGPIGPRGIWHAALHREWTVGVLTLAGACVGAPTWMALRRVASGPAGALASLATVGAGVAVASLGWRSANPLGLLIDVACLAGIAVPLGAAVTLWLPSAPGSRPPAASAGPFAPPRQDQAPPPRDGLVATALWFAGVDAGIAAMVLGSQFVPAMDAVASHATRSLTVGVTLGCFALGGAVAHAPAWLALRRAGVWPWPAAIGSGYAGFAASGICMIAAKKLISGARFPVGGVPSAPVALFFVVALLAVGLPFALAGAGVTVRASPAFTRRPVRRASRELPPDDPVEAPGRDRRFPGDG